MQPTVVLVTGANTSLGFEVVKILVVVSKDPNKAIILLGSRDIQRGQEATSRLDSPSNVHLLQLGILSQDNIARATNEIKEKYNGYLDITINNAEELNQLAKDFLLTVGQDKVDTSGYDANVCPGYCATDLNNHEPSARSAELRADYILHTGNTPQNELEKWYFLSRWSNETASICMHNEPIQTWEYCET
ncbi:unnamed protein product, partial [Rotaria sp. Silwood2]